MLGWWTDGPKGQKTMLRKLRIDNFGDYIKLSPKFVQ
jgi:hypothetical protein